MQPAQAPEQSGKQGRCETVRTSSGRRKRRRTNPCQNNVGKGGKWKGTVVGKILQVCPKRTGAERDEERAMLEVDTDGGVGKMWQEEEATKDKSRVGGLARMVWVKRAVGNGTPSGTYRSSGSANGQQLYTGSRGGNYYVTSSGNRRYV